MNVRLNGKSISLPAEIDTVAELIRHYELENRIVIVEIDKNIIEKTLYAETELKEGSEIEMIHFVGGG
ncbi:sulfur carrier protein ThiS [Bacillus massilinigeriensis]|uniref:sulfur carrier protein ThiS n=1 Tax=Bacillus mediterraneensis TaxID=1805474 RepID=UPI0008F87C12|nr:sulfur carrier protein ThiS [Bacillus mediterraneensis]